MRPLVKLFAVVCVAVLLLATVNCDVQSFKQHMEAEKKMKLMMDPSANYKYFKHEADMTFIMPEFYDKFGHEEERFKRLTRTTAARWENGIIPYMMCESYSAHNRDVVLMALSHYEEKTCLRFVEQTNERAYLIFCSGAGCRSFVGKQSRQPQGVSIPQSCINEFHLVLHEIGHAIGLLHEHTRPDRDDYVDVIYDNIYAGFRREFEIEDAETADTLGVGYDYNSVMHYKPGAFANDSTPGITIVADNPGIPVGPGNALSELDVLKINRLYECPDVHPPRSTIYVPPSEPGLPPLTKACGRRFDGDMNGIITSPGFPEYRTNQDCEWQLRVPIGFQIRFDFKTVDLHQSPGCQDGYFEIYENPDCTGFLITRHRLCSAPYHPFYSFSNKACVRYRSENPSNANDLTGIEITFTADDENECFFSAICEHQCVNTPGGYYCTCPEGYFLAPDGRRCFDVNECAMEGHMCDYKCENFGGHHECTCPDGSTQVGNSCANSVDECLHNNGGCEHLCTDTEESYFCTCRDQYLLQADRHSCKLVIIPLVLAIPAPTLPAIGSCGGGLSLLTALKDSIQTVGWPSTAYPLNVECTWDIVCPAGSKIEIEFEDPFRIAGSMPSCAEDSVVVSECNSTITHGPFCHLTRPESFETNCNAVKVTFESKGSRGDTRHGFKMNYICKSPTALPTPHPTTARPTTARPTTARPTTPRLTTVRPTTPRPTTPRPTVPTTTPTLTLSPQCGGGPEVRRDSQGFVETLGWSTGQAYPINTFCKWKIECPPSQKVRLFFSSSFRVAGQMPSCSKDQLMVWDCNRRIPHGPFCNLVPPVPRISQCNAVEVEFDSGSGRGSSRTGFRLSYECV